MFTNENKTSLPIALWLATDDYDLIPRPNVISATTLIKPLRQILLGMRLGEGDYCPDVLDMFASRFGSALHSGIEKTWLNDEKRIQGLKALGYSDKLINRIKVNPSSVSNDDIPMYLELRTEKYIELFDTIISGCADIILDGALHDIKSTGTFSWGGAHDEKYKLQLSIYRWLNQDKVHEDIGFIEFLFKDWSKLQAMMHASYPQKPVIQRPIELYSIAETEQYIFNRLAEIHRHKRTGTLPECSQEDLWAEPDKYQYFSNPGAQRATKNFSSHAEAQTHLLTKGKGVIKVKKGKSKACGYCQCRNICDQYQQLVQENRV